MYYERISEGWKPNYKKSALFNGSTYPIDIVPVGFWNGDRKQATDSPAHDSSTHKLVGPQDLGGSVGYVVEALSAEGLAAVLEAKRSMMILSPWQFRKAVNAEGKRTIVEAALTSMTEDEQDGWHVASSFERLNPLVIKLAQEILGFNDSQLDNFFINGAKL